MSKIFAGLRSWVVSLDIKKEKRKYGSDEPRDRIGIKTQT